MYNCVRLLLHANVQHINDLEHFVNVEYGCGKQFEVVLSALNLNMTLWLYFDSTSRMNVSPTQAILMAMSMWRCWSNACNIAWCSMSRRATPEATGRCHRVTTCSVSPRRPPGRQSSKQQCKMCPLCWPFWWPLWCGGTIPHTSLDGGSSWLS